MKEATMESVMRPESAVAEDLKNRLAQALDGVQKVMDEAATLGFETKWDGIVQAPPFGKHAVVNLRLIRTY